MEEVRGEETKGLGSGGYSTAIQDTVQHTHWQPTHFHGGEREGTREGRAGPQLLLLFVTSAMAQATVTTRS
jgi:hypothetical protein